MKNTFKIIWIGIALLIVSCAPLKTKHESKMPSVLVEKSLTREEQIKILEIKANEVRAISKEIYKISLKKYKLAKKIKNNKNINAKTKAIMAEIESLKQKTIVLNAELVKNLKLVTENYNKEVF
jgi:hypothetical protein